MTFYGFLEFPIKITIARHILRKERETLSGGIEEMA
jgi:hypothetical protein